MIDKLTKADFAAHINSRFLMMPAEGASVELELVEVSEGGKSPVYEVFSLIFRAPGNAPRAAQIYDLKHEKLGELALFLSPFKLEGGSIYYEAAFNRLLKP